MDYNAGDTIGAYRLQEQCGSGSFGQVFLAENLFSGQIVALKLLSAAEKNMQRELDGLIRFRSCRHPNLLPIHHIDKINGRLYYTMPPADNLAPEQDYQADTLAHRLNSSAPLSSSEVMTMTQELLAGLQELHRHQLLHRDIKPDNILWLGRQAVLADIGLVGSDSDDAICGTPGFVLKEVLCGQRKATAADDLYALGKVIYCALTGLGAKDFPRLPQKLSDPIGKRLFQTACAACSTRHALKTTEDFRRILNSPDRSGKRRFKIWLAGSVLLAIFLLIWLPVSAGRKRSQVTAWKPPTPPVTAMHSAAPSRPPELPIKVERSPYPDAPQRSRSADSKRLFEMRRRDIDDKKELALLREKYLQLMQRYTPELQEKCRKRSSEISGCLLSLDKSISDPLAHAEAKRELNELQSKDILCQLHKSAFFCKHNYELFLSNPDISSSGLSSMHGIMDDFKNLLDFYDAHCQMPK